MKGGERLDHMMKRLKKKEEDALMELMNLYGNHLLRLALLLVKDHQLAEEVVQDVFVIAFKKIEQLSDEKKLKSWLITITTNECRQRMRKWSWKNIFLHQKDGGEDGIVDDKSIPLEEIFIISTRNQHLHEQIQQLSYKYREVIALYYFEEQSVKQIAMLINEKEATIKTRLSRGRGLLRILLEKDGDDIAQ